VKTIDLEKSRALIILYARMRGIVLIKKFFLVAALVLSIVLQHFVVSFFDT
jgi:hypothetical protein